MFSSGLLDISYAPYNQMASTIMNLTFSLTDPFRIVTAASSEVISLAGMPPLINRGFAWLDVSF